MPKPLGADRKGGVALFEFVDGTPYRPGEVTDGDIEAALAFLEALDHARDEPAARALGNGAEATFSLAGHLEIVDRRVRALDGITGETPIGQRSSAFCRHTLTPAWRRLRIHIEQACTARGLDMECPIEERDRRLSPSDFGFHNALRTAEGRPIFLDFEYAGWDDPAKIVADFFNQVAVPVPDRYYSGFADALAARTSDPAMHRQRFDLLVPVYRIKWACIVMNAFLPDGAARRRFAGRHGIEAHQEKALDRAITLVRGLEAAALPA